jgi:hypothetical protein
MPDENSFSSAEMKQHLLHNTSCILAISVWNNDDARQRAENLCAKALLDKTNLYGDLNRWIKALCSPDGASG